MVGQQGFEEKGDMPDIIHVSSFGDKRTNSIVFIWFIALCLSYFKDKSGFQSFTSLH